MHVSSRAGWADIRLLAPRAELRLLLTGGTTLIDGSKLSFLGEALRALLVMEMRGLTVRNVPHTCLSLSGIPECVACCSCTNASSTHDHYAPVCGCSQLLSSSPCSKTPANLPLGCSALRCEVRHSKAHTQTIIWEQSV